MYEDSFSVRLIDYPRSASQMRRERVWLAVRKGECGSTSEIARQLLESAREDRSEVADPHRY